MANNQKLRVKFTERPEVPVQGRKVALQVAGENGMIVKAALNRKTLKKQVERLDSFYQLGSCGSRKSCQFPLKAKIELGLAAGVNVFEKETESSGHILLNRKSETTENQTVCNQATSTQTPEPEPKPVERTKKTFRLVK